MRTHYKYLHGAALSAIMAVLLASARPSSGAEAAPSADSLTLDQVIRQVVEKNDRVAAARFMQEAAERRVASAGVWDDPMLMLGAQNVPTNFDFTMDPMTMKMVGLSQNIPYAGYKGLERKAAQAEARAAEEDRRGTEIDLVAAAKTAYYDAYYLQQNLREFNLQREILEEVYTSSISKLRTNQTGQEDVLSSQAEIWRLETTILSTEQEITAAVARLNSLRGESPDAPLSPLAAPPEIPLPESADTWISAAEVDYPPLARLNRQAEVYNLSARASRRMAWPMLNVEASYGFRSGYDIGMDGMSEARDDMVSFQAKLSVPIFSGGGQRAMARSMEAMQRGTEAEAAQLRRDIKADLVTLYERARRLSQTLASYRNQIIPATEDAFRSALAGYTANRTTFASLSSYSLTFYRDRITANQVANELARTLSEADRYTKGTTGWASTSAASEQSK